MGALISQFNALCEQACAIWISGGWGMIAIAVNALVLFALGFHVLLKFRGQAFQSIPERIWRRWIDYPAERKGSMGDMIDFATSGNSIKETAVLFKELHTAEIVPFERDLRLMKVCVGTAPLLGLLGTVTGMLTTFGALASGSGGEKTMALIAKGISEALITTETGLVIALPGLLFQHQLARQHEKYKAFMTHLETICMQNVYKKIRKSEMER